jgi:hypothetical protein
MVKKAVDKVMAANTQNIISTVDIS